MSGEFNYNDLAIRMGMNQTKSDGSGDGANEKNIFDFLFDLAPELFGKASKLGGVPNVKDIESAAVTKPFDSQGVQQKMMNMAAQAFGSPGGFLYRVLSALFKDSSVTDHTQGIDGSMHIASSGDHSGGGSGGGESGGGGGGGGNYGEASISDMAGVPMGGGGAHIEPMTVSYGGRDYEVAHMSNEVLGNITPSAGADLGSIKGRGDIEIG